MTESFLSGQSKVVKIVLDEPLSESSVFTVTETGIDGLACGMMGGSSFHEEKSKEAFTLMTNETDLPIEVAPELADVRGDIEIIEDPLKIDAKSLNQMKPEFSRPRK